MYHFTQKFWRDLEQKLWGVEAQRHYWLFIFSNFCYRIVVNGEVRYFILADRTKGRAYATVLRLSVCLSVCLFTSSVTLCIVAKRTCVLEQKLLLGAYRKLYMRNRLVPK